MVFGLLILVGANGLAHFWPGRVAALELRLVDGGVARVLGEIVDEETVAVARVRDAGGIVPDDMLVVTRYLIKVGNRDFSGNDFRWIAETEITKLEYPSDAVVAERSEWGNFYGFAQSLREADDPVVTENLWDAVAERLARSAAFRAEIAQIERHEIGGINYQIERLRLRERERANDPAALATAAASRADLQTQFSALTKKLADLRKQNQRDKLIAHTSDGTEAAIPLSSIVRAFRPNQMSWWQKVRHYGIKLAEFTTDEPREANTEGGVFPAIFGTVLMVIVMSIVATPFGVVAAIYLREYARPGPVTAAIRIAVNNLAGVPSVVYGVFGFGFFVYFLGGSIDQIFFSNKLPAPTFGTPGLLWSSLTLALLTVPVVIVATEEGLTRIPRAIREGSLALGATKAETLWRTVLPMATPAMMTGLILAVARAAGEVAPLMMVGVVKLAPSLPLDTDFPFLHLDRKFMHLGFHIYDVGFQSPNVEAARPLVYATALLLVVIIMSLNLAAIQIRNRLREKYNAADH